MDGLVSFTALLLRDLTGRLRAGLRARTGSAPPEGGVSTLEMVIIALGLMAVAGLLVAAITAAVTSRTDQLK